MTVAPSRHVNWAAPIGNEGRDLRPGDMVQAPLQAPRGANLAQRRPVVARRLRLPGRIGRFARWEKRLTVQTVSVFLRACPKLS